MDWEGSEIVIIRLIISHLKENCAVYMILKLDLASHFSQDIIPPCHLVQFQIFM